MKRQILSNETKNSFGFVVLNDTIVWTRFRKNPVLMLNHPLSDDSSKRVTDPIGRVEDIRLENGSWTGVLVFADTELGEHYKNLYESGMMQAVSIAGPATLVKDADGNEYTSRFEVWEISLVAVPSNPDALPLDSAESREALAVNFVATETQCLCSLSADTHTQQLITKYKEKMKSEDEKKPLTEETSKEEIALGASAVEENKEDAENGKESFFKALAAEFAGWFRNRAEKEEKPEVDASGKEEKTGDGGKSLSAVPGEPKQETAALQAKEGAKIMKEMEVKMITPDFESLDAYGADKKCQAKLRRLKLAAGPFEGAVSSGEKASVADDLRELASVMASDEKFMATLGHTRFTVESASGAKTSATVAERLVALQAGAGSNTFMENNPDLAVVVWSSKIYRILYPLNHFSDFIPRITSDKAGTIHVEAAAKPKIYFGRNVPTSAAANYIYDDDPIAIPTRTFALQPVLWQPNNDQLLGYDKRGLGQYESLEAVHNAQHNYIIQQIADAAKYKVATSGATATVGAGSFPENSGATGSVKLIGFGDLQAMQGEFIGDNYDLMYEQIRVVMGKTYWMGVQQIQELTSILTAQLKRTESMWLDYSSLSMMPRSITTLYDTATSAVIDPELYGEPLNADGSIQASYTPPVIPATAYGVALAFLPSQAILGIGRTNVHMVADPNMYGWKMSMDSRMGCGAGRKDGSGIGLLIPTKVS